MLDEVERSRTRRVQTARAWPRAAQHKRLRVLIELIFNYSITKKIFMFSGMKCVCARPQAVACEWQDRRQRPRMPKAPARPMVQSAFRAKGLWRGK